MPGLIGLGSQSRTTANNALGTAGNLEQRRERKEEQLEQQEESRQTSAVATGASIGTSIAPGWGTVIGAGVGLLANELF